MNSGDLGHKTKMQNWQCSPIITTNYQKESNNHIYRGFGNILKNKLTTEVKDLRSESHKTLIKEGRRDNK